MIKTTLLLLISCTGLIAETRTEAEARNLREQLAATKAALSAAEARVKTLQSTQSGTQKLTDAVRDATATNKEGTAEVKAVADRLIESQESGKKAAEKVAAANQSATQKLAAVVTTGQTAFTTAITAQIKQQERSLAAARDVARKLEQSNRELAKTNEENRLAKEETAARLGKVNADLQDLKSAAAIAAAKDLGAFRHDLLQFFGIATPLACTVLLALIGLRKAGKDKAKWQETTDTLGEIKNVQESTHGLVNGKHEKLLSEKRELEEEVARLRRAAEGQ